MSEHVHVHAPHEFTESEAAPSVRSERIMELVATLLLAIATLGIAWSGYQGARWNGRQAEEYSAANGVHSGANRATTQGDQERTQDLLNFNRWLEVTTEGNQQLVPTRSKGAATLSYAQFFLFRFAASALNDLSTSWLYW